jgi:hypothetical protein
MTSTSTDTARTTSVWQRIADTLAFMDQSPGEQAEWRFRALEARVEALERKLPKD